MKRSKADYNKLSMRKKGPKKNWNQRFMQILINFYFIYRISFLFNKRNFCVFHNLKIFEINISTHFINAKSQQLYSKQKKH